MARYQPHDKFYRRAREQGLPSRAAFKLDELLTRFPLVRPGARVADLGCAPGGWLAVLASAVGPRGRVVGVDLALARAPWPNVIALAGDIRETATRTAVAGALGGSADLVTSDLAPRLSGIADRDQALSFGLLMDALGFARALLRPGGTMVAKLFMSNDFSAVTEAFAAAFAKVEVARTRATRPGSSELYLIARDFRAPSPPFYPEDPRLP